MTVLMRSLDVRSAALEKAPLSRLGRSVPSPLVGEG